MNGLGLRTIYASVAKRDNAGSSEPPRYVRIVLREQLDKSIVEADRFMTHLAYGGTDIMYGSDEHWTFITGHYEMNISNAAEDFTLRCQAEGIDPKI